MTTVNPIIEFIVSNPTRCDCPPVPELCDYKTEVHGGNTLRVDILGRNSHKITIPEHDDDSTLVNYICGAAKEEHDRMTLGFLMEIEKNGQLKIHKYCPKHGHLIVSYPCPSQEIRFV